MRGTVIKKLCTAENLSSSLKAFLAIRLISLDKNPGLRPIRVGEVLQRIVGKMIIIHERDDIVTSVGSFQICAVHGVGCESLIYVMRRGGSGTAATCKVELPVVNYYHKELHLECMTPHA